MDYEKEYKDAMARMELCVRTGLKITPEYIFPEIADGEDERIRKIIVKHFREYKGDSWITLQIPSILAYLEKQKEYELTEEDKKIIPEALVMLCNDIINHRVHTPIKTDEEGARKIKAFLKTFNRQPYKTKEEWEKQKEQKLAEVDVKALLTADRLASAEMTGRLKERSEILENPEKYGLKKSAEWSEEDKGNLLDVKCIIDEVWHNQHVREEIDHSGEELESLWHWLDTIWQRVEYPYQKVEWSEEDKVMLDNIIWGVHMKSIKPLDEMDDRSKYEKYEDFLKALPERFNLQPKQEWSDDDERMRNQLIYDVEHHKKDDLISAKQNKATKALYNGIEKCYDEKIAWLKSLPKRFNLEPKQEWSEKDEKTINDACCWIAEYAGYLMDKNYSKASMLMGLTDKLKSLRSQPRQEWSEEDEQYLLVCKNALNKYQQSDHWDANTISKWLEERLKSLHPSWKPSKEQMEAVKHAYNSFPNDCHTKSNLRLLYYDLEKLM